MADIIKAGQVIYLTHGAYSGLEIEGVFVALEDFDPNEHAQLFHRDNPEHSDTTYFKATDFVGYLFKKGLLIDVQSRELYLGDGKITDVALQ